MISKRYPIIISYIVQARKRRKHTDQNEDIKPLADNMIVYIDNPKQHSS